MNVNAWYLVHPHYVRHVSVIAFIKVKKLKRYLIVIVFLRTKTKLKGPKQNNQDY